MTSLSNLEMAAKGIEYDKAEDDVDTTQRVGGRLVTRREIVRSRKCTCYSN